MQQTAHTFLRNRTGFLEFFLVSTITIILGVLSLSATVYWCPSTNDIFFVLFLLASLSLLLLGAIGTYIVERMSRPPPNTPSRYIVNTTKPLPSSSSSSSSSRSEDRTPVLVCVGDSITHGAVSANFVDSITARIQTKLHGNNSNNSETPPPPPLEVINAGQNSICMHTILQERIAQTLACNPNYITIFIGTNDIRGIYCKAWGRQSTRLWNLPEVPSFEVYERNFADILDRFVRGSNTTASMIGVCTLPPMGEDLNCRANDCVRRANDILRKVVKRYETTGRVMVIDVYGVLAEAIERLPAVPGWENRYHRVDDFMSTALWMNVMYHVFGVSWTDLSRRVGNKVLSDSLHINELGRDLIVNAIVDWLISCGPLVAKAK